MDFTKILTDSLKSVTATKVATSLLWSFLGFGVYKVLALVYGEFTSPLRHIPGPPSNNLIFGNFRELSQTDSSGQLEEWIEEYGPTVKYHGLLNIQRLFTADLKALSHILTNSYDYQKPEAASYSLRRVLGNGLLFIEGDIHRQQRRIMSPAFNPQQIRELTVSFIDKSIQLRDIWAAEVVKQGPVARLDALSWLSRATLDVIGLTAFNYHFGALTDDPEKNELNNAFGVLFKSGSSINLISLLRSGFPILRFLPAKNDAEEKVASDTMARIGSGLLRDSKAALAAEDSKSKSRKDLLSVLVHANADTNLPEHKRLSDQDVLAQIPTFFIAGHESTSVASAWAFYALTQDKDIQNKLREELLTIPTDNPTMDDLNSLSYLDKFVRETLRLHPPAPSTGRVAMKDDVLPLNTPITDLKGNVHHNIRISKGDIVIMSVAVMNRAKWLWGEDAMEFKPERWEKVPDAVAGIPGVWGNMLTFLGGPRGCIGYRFAIIEMKAMLFTLVRAFEFDLAVPAKDIVKKSNIMQRPVLATDPNNANQLPLLVKPISEL